MWSLQAPLDFLTSLKRGRGILLTSTGLLAAMLTNLASRIATAHETWTHLPKGKGHLSRVWLQRPVAFSPQAGPQMVLPPLPNATATSTSKFLGPSEVRSTASPP